MPSQLALLAELEPPAPEPGRKPLAIFSECEEHAWPRTCAEACEGRRYRYILAYPTGIDNDRICCFCLANPSTATAEDPDPTVTRTIDYARRWGFGWSLVVNVRAWRATDPEDVPEDRLALRPANDDWIRHACQAAELVVCGWGNLAGKQGHVVEDLIRSTGNLPHALKLNKDGSPTHPLYLSASLRPFPMEANHA